MWTAWRTRRWNVTSCTVTGLSAPKVAGAGTVGNSKKWRTLGLRTRRNTISIIHPGDNGPYSAWPQMGRRQASRTNDRRSWYAELGAETGHRSIRVHWRPISFPAATRACLCAEVLTDCRAIYPDCLPAGETPCERAGSDPSPSKADQTLDPKSGHSRSEAAGGSAPSLVVPNRRAITRNTNGDRFSNACCQPSNKSACGPNSVTFGLWLVRLF